MGDEQDCGTVRPLQFHHDIHDPRLGRDVERRGRLVRDHEPGFGRERHGDQHALAHAARKLVWIAGQQAGGIAQMHRTERRERRLAPVRDAEAFEMLVELVPDGQHRVQGRQRLLRNERDVPPQQRPVPRRRHCQQVRAVERQRSAGDSEGRRQHTGDDAPDHGFAGAGLAYQPKHLAGGERKIDVPQHGHVAHANVQALGVEDHSRPSTIRTSSVRRSPSPSRLKPATVTKIASTGANKVQGA